MYWYEKYKNISQDDSTFVEIDNTLYEYYLKITISKNKRMMMFRYYKKDNELIRIYDTKWKPNYIKFISRKIAKDKYPEFFF